MNNYSIYHILGKVIGIYLLTRFVKLTPFFQALIVFFFFDALALFFLYGGSYSLEDMLHTVVAYPFRILMFFIVIPLAIIVPLHAKADSNSNWSARKKILFLLLNISWIYYLYTLSMGV